MGNENVERLLDLVADALIQSQFVDSSTVTVNQKTIRNGAIQTGRDGDDRLVLYQKDIEANIADLQQTITTEEDEVIPELQYIADNVDFSTLTILIQEFQGGADEDPNPQTETQVISIFLQGGGDEFNGRNITDLIISGGEFSNVSQFMPIVQESSNVNVEVANEYLDTNIFELLPTADTRQARIIRFFQELNALLPTNQPEFDLDSDGRVDRNQTGDWLGGGDYSLNNSISTAQSYPNDSTIEEEEAFIHRLKATSINANESIAKPNDTNQDRTIEDIYNRIKPYLTDILEEPLSLADERPEYQNKSNGYLQFRNLNQGIIIRNTNQDYLEGLNPNNPTWLETGFTITMWVKFLDKTSQGTLFNFGNCERDSNPLGFKLETYVINGNDVPTNADGEFIQGFGNEGDDVFPITWKQIFADGNPNNLTYQDEEPSEGFFSTNDTERFVRLVVSDGDRLRGSHVGMPFFNRRAGLPHFATTTGPPRGGYDYYTDPDEPLSPYDHTYGLMTNTRIPMDFQEWYFICASFNPLVEEDESHTDSNIYSNYRNNPDFWRNNINIDGEFVPSSDLGARCKVEIISRTDLLRARGFKV